MAKFTAKQLYDKYSNGFSGCIYEPHVFDHYMENAKYAYFSDGAKKIKNSGKGQLSRPYLSYLKFDKEAFTERQTLGDCQNGSDLVRMADGSEKQIKDIEIGEYVISANGNKRKVINVFKKPYNKQMVQISVDGYSSKIASTPDHKYIIDAYTMETKPIGELKIGEKVFIPSIEYENQNIKFDLKNIFSGESVVEETDYKKLRLVPVEKNKIRPKNGQSINRFISLDHKLSWLVGLYSAEGGCDGENGKLTRVTFNLGSHEAIIAEQVRQYIKDIFDIEAKVYQVPSKPSVIYVRVYNGIIAELFSYLCSGNTYSKKLSKELFITTKENRLALIKGWFDGDGHKGKYGSVAVSVSKQLVLDYANISNSVNLQTSILHRKAYKHSKECWTLRMHSQSSSVFNISKTKYVSKITNKDSLVLGMMKTIKSINMVSPESNYVYCIEVEKDHNFICNGFGINNCTSHSTRNACDISRAVEIDIKGEKEAWVARGATEAIYGQRGHGGEGSSCARTVEFVTKVGGIIARQNYPGIADFSKYNGSMGGNWGSRGLPDKVLDLANDHQMKTASLIRTIEEARDALANGYGLTVCSNQGFSSVRDKKGFAKPQGQWAHAMSWTACDDTGSDISFLICNSWGNWNSGGHPEWGQLPNGSFLIHSDVAERMIKQNGAFAISNFDGFPVQKLPDYGFDDYL